MDNLLRALTASLAIVFLCLLAADAQSEVLYTDAEVAALFGKRPLILPVVSEMMRANEIAIRHDDISSWVEFLAFHKIDPEKTILVETHSETMGMFSRRQISPSFDLVARRHRFLGPSEKPIWNFRGAYLLPHVDQKYAELFFRSPHEGELKFLGGIFQMIPR